MAFRIQIFACLFSLEDWVCFLWFVSCDLKGYGLVCSCSWPWYFCDLIAFLLLLKLYELFTHCLNYTLSCVWQNYWWFSVGILFLFCVLMYQVPTFCQFIHVGALLLDCHETHIQSPCGHICLLASAIQSWIAVWSGKLLLCDVRNSWGWAFGVMLRYHISCPCVPSDNLHSSPVPPHSSCSFPLMHNPGDNGWWWLKKLGPCHPQGRSGLHASSLFLPVLTVWAFERWTSS